MNINEGQHTPMPKTSLKKAPPVRIKERRAWVRYHCELKIQCASGKSRRGTTRFNYQNLGKRWQAKVFEISRGGMKLEVACCFKEGAPFHIELDREPGNKPLTIAARVTHVGPNRNGIWTIGCSFCKPLSRGELNILLRFGPGSPDHEPLLVRLGRLLRHGLAFLGLRPQGAH